MEKSSNIEIFYIKEEKGIENLAGKCRGCLMEEEGMNYLFDDKGQRDEKGFCSLADILLRTTGTEVKLEDAMPSHLCQQCSDAIIDFYNFKTIFIETEDFLNKIRFLKSEEEIKNAEVFDVQIHSDFVYNTDKISVINKTRNESIKIEKSKESELRADIAKISRNTRRRKKRNSKDDLEPQRFVCEVCGFSCKKKEYLANHQETHTEERKYVCQYCNKAVKLKSSFIKHLKLHTHPRQIVCDMCGQRFNLRAHLDIHYKAKHLHIRDFQCKLCDKAFSMKATLEQHIERHNPNRERKFGCKFCNMTYMEKRHLVRHHREKHDEVKFNCPFCERSYIQAGDLKKHLKKCHPSPDQSSANQNAEFAVTDDDK